MPRGGMGRAYLHKAAFDATPVDYASWYAVEGPMPALLHSTFHQLAFDSDTQAFLEASRSQSDSVCLQLWYNLATWLLSVRLSKTSINGLLGRGGMFLFSRAQLGDFLQLPPEWDKNDKSVLDLGAGDGGITSVMQEFYPKVLATEASDPMRWRLTERGFQLLSLEEWATTSAPLSLVSALNLLDRHPEPFVLLRQLRALSRANDDAPVILAAVFPWYQYSEFSASHVPKDQIVLKRGTFAQQVHQFVSQVLHSSGFKVIRWSKLPYLCEGDAYQSYYILFDALFLIVPDNVSE